MFAQPTKKIPHDFIVVAPIRNSLAIPASNLSTVGAEYDHPDAGACVTQFAHVFAAPVTFERLVYFSPINIENATAACSGT